MNRILYLIISMLVGYLFGSLPVGYLYCKSKGVNIFELGSKNPGSTNVGRVLGRRAGLTVFFLDILKTIIPVLFFAYNYLIFGYEISLLFKNIIIVYTGLFVIIGHNYPIYFLFKNGGKGITCSIATIICFSPLFAAIIFLIYLLLKKITKIVSIGSIASSIVFFPLSLIFVLLYIYPFNFEKSYLLLPATFIMSALSIYRHRENIKRLLSGTESKINA